MPRLENKFLANQYFNFYWLIANYTKLISTPNTHDWGITELTQEPHEPNLNMIFQSPLRQWAQKLDA